MAQFITILFKIESDIDYYQHMDLLKDSIQKWVTIHPFLSAKIEKIQFGRYFIFNETINIFNNVKFYCIESLRDEYKMKYFI